MYFCQLLASFWFCDAQMANSGAGRQPSGVSTHLSVLDTAAFSPTSQARKLKRLQTLHCVPTKCQLTTFFVTRRFVAILFSPKRHRTHESSCSSDLWFVGAGFQQHTAEVVAGQKGVWSRYHFYETWHKICRWNSWTGTSTGLVAFWGQLLE